MFPSLYILHKKKERKKEYRIEKHTKKYSYVHTYIQGVLFYVWWFSIWLFQFYHYCSQVTRDWVHTTTFFSTKFAPILIMHQTVQNGHQNLVIGLGKRITIATTTTALIPRLIKTLTTLRKGHGKVVKMPLLFTKGLITESVWKSLHT